MKDIYDIFIICGHNGWHFDKNNKYRHDVIIIDQFSSKSITDSEGSDGL